MSVEALIANLLRVAQEDLDGARLLAKQPNRNAIYLLEQSAEKIIRAVLTSEGTHAGIKHQLDEMVSMIPDTNPMKRMLRDIEYRRVCNEFSVPDAGWPHQGGAEFGELRRGRQEGCCCTAGGSEAP